MFHLRPRRPEYYITTQPLRKRPVVFEGVVGNKLDSATLEEKIDISNKTQAPALTLKANKT